MKTPLLGAGLVGFVPLEATITSPFSSGVAVSRGGQTATGRSVAGAPTSAAAPDPGILRTRR